MTVLWTVLFFVFTKRLTSMSIFSKIYVQQHHDEYEDDNVPTYEFISKDEFDVDDIEIPSTFLTPWHNDDYSQEGMNWKLIATLAVAGAIVGASIYFTLREVDNFKKIDKLNESIRKAQREITNAEIKAVEDALEKERAERKVEHEKDMKNAELYSKMWGALKPKGDVISAVNKTGPEMIKSGTKLAEQLADVESLMINIKPSDELSVVGPKVDAILVKLFPLNKDIPTMDELYTLSKWPEDVRDLSVVRSLAADPFYKISTALEAAYAGMFDKNTFGWLESASDDFDRLIGRFKRLSESADKTASKLKDKEFAPGVKSKLDELSDLVKKTERKFKDAVSFHNRAAAGVGIAISSTHMHLSKEVERVRSRLAGKEDNATLQSFQPTIEFDDVYLPGIDDYTQQKANWGKIAQLALSVALIGAGLYFTLKDADNIAKAAEHNKKVFERMSEINREAFKASMGSYKASAAYEEKAKASKDQSDSDLKAFFKLTAPSGGTLIQAANKTGPEMIKSCSAALDIFRDINMFVINLKEDDESDSTVNKLDGFMTKLKTAYDGMATLPDLYKSSGWSEDLRDGDKIKKIATSIEFAAMMLMDMIEHPLSKNWMGWFADDSDFSKLQSDYKKYNDKLKQDEDKLKEAKYTDVVSDKLKELNRASREVIGMMKDQINYHTAAADVLRLATAPAMNTAKDVEKADKSTMQSAIIRHHSNIASFPYDANASVTTFLTEHGGVFNTTDSLLTEVSEFDGATKTMLDADESISIVEREIHRNGCVCREQVETIIKYHGPFLPPSVPVNSFTAESTEQNLDIVKEAIAFKRTPPLMSAIANAATQLEHIVNHIQNTDHSQVVSAIEDMSNQANELLGLVKDYEAVAPTMYLHMGDGLDKDDEAKRVVKKLRVMELTVTTDELVKFKDLVLDAVDDMKDVVEALHKALDKINDKNLLKDVPVLIAADAAKEKVSLPIQDEEFIKILAKLTEELSEFDLKEVDDLHETLKREWAFYEQGINYTKEAMRTNVGNSYEYAEHVMTSLTKDFLVPRQIMLSDALETHEDMTELLTCLKALHYKGKKPLFAIAQEITLVTTHIRKLCEYYVSLHQMVTSGLYFYSKLACDKMRVVGVVVEQQDGLIKSKDALALAGLIKSKLRKSHSEVIE